MDFRLLYLIIWSVVSWNFVLCHEGSLETKCDLNDVTNPNPPCTKNETCTAKSGVSGGVCRCKPSYEYHRGLCLLKPTPPTSLPASAVSTASPDHAHSENHKPVSTGAITAAVLVPLLLASVVLLIMLGRRYRCFERLQLLQGRRYEEVRIGQEDEDDDPPLA